MNVTVMSRKLRQSIARFNKRAMTNKGTIYTSGKITETMKDINAMRLGVLKELKNVRRFLDNMEKSVKLRNPEAIQRAYMFLVHLVREMDDGLLTPSSIALDVAIAQILKEDD